MRKPADVRAVALSVSPRNNGRQHNARTLVRSRIAALLKPTNAERGVDFAVKITGSPAFVDFNLVWIGAWAIINLGLVPGINPFDPFPFRLLMIMLPSEALLLAILTGLNQRRLKRFAQKTEQLDALIQMPPDEDVRGTIGVSKREVVRPASGP